MKIKIIQSIAGHADPNSGLPEFCFQPGDIFDISKALGSAWVASGIAEEIPEPEKETKKGKK